MPTRSKAYGWNIMMLLACSQVLAYVDRVNLAVVGPQYLIRELHYTPAAFGVLMSVFNWSFTIALLLAGPFTDWVRARIAFPVGVGIWSAATALCSVTTGFLPLAILRGLVGVGEAPMIPSGSRVIRETFPKERRGVVVGAFFAGNKFGLTLGIPLASNLYLLWGWPSVFYVTGGLGLAWLVWWSMVYRAPSAASAAEETASRADPTYPRVRWASLLRYRTTWGLMLGQAGYLYIFYVFATWLPGYLVLQRKMSLLNTGFVGMLPFLISTACVVLGGWAADRLIKRGYRVTRVRKSFAVGGLFGATVFTIAGAYADATWLAVAMLTLSVTSFSFATAAVNAMPIDVAPPHIVSSLVSLQNFGGNLGGSFAPWVTGLLISTTGDFTVPLLVAAGVSLVFGCGAYGLVVGSLDRDLRAAGTR